MSEDNSEIVLDENKDIDNQEPDEISEDEIKEFLHNAREQEKLLETLIENQISVKDKLINKLHDELDFYKQDTANKFVDQVMKGIIKVRKDMQKRMLSARFEEMQADELRLEYRYAFEDLTDLLEQQNIDEFSTEAGSNFDPAIHQPKTEYVTVKELDKKVKESISEGYRKGNRVLLPERVVVYQYQEKE